MVVKSFPSQIMKRLYLVNSVTFGISRFDWNSGSDPAEQEFGRQDKVSMAFAQCCRNTTRGSSFSVLATNIIRGDGFLTVDAQYSVLPLVPVIGCCVSIKWRRATFYRTEGLIIELNRPWRKPGKP